MGFPADTWTKLAGVLSGGEQTRLRLARLLLERPDLLILDEPTNHLDLETMEWLENYLKAYRGAVLVVSHDRYFLDAVCTRIWELRGKSIKTYRGNYSAYLPQREAADERQQKLHDAAVEKAAKLQDYVDRNLVRASTTKMAQSRRKQLEKLEIVEAPTTEAWELNFRFEYDIEPYDELVIMKNLSVHIGERTLIDALDYVVHRGDKLVIAGPNGAGKSTLLQVLDGKRRPSGGMVRLGSGAKPGVFTQQQARRAGRVIDAIWNQYPRFTELEVRSHLARFGYRGEEIAVTQLFDTFKDWKTVKRVLCGMGWASLWIFLWSLIPVVGIVFGIIRAYEYRLTPYILMHEPDVPITEAIKVSREKTRGYKARMFGADALYVVVIAAAEILLALLATIPYIGVLFGILSVVFTIAASLFGPLFLGLVQAAFYEEITHRRVCPRCGVELSPDARFCYNCGYGADGNTGSTPELPAAVVCPQCGAPVKPGTVFCGQCGCRIN